MIKRSHELTIVFVGRTRYTCGFSRNPLGGNLPLAALLEISPRGNPTFEKAAMKNASASGVILKDTETQSAMSTSGICAARGLACTCRADGCLKLNVQYSRIYRWVSRQKKEKKKKEKKHLKDSDRL